MTLMTLAQQDPVVTVEDLARRFDVSAQTIRRDFQSLEEQGLLTRTYGGAISRSDGAAPLSHEAAFLARESEQAAQKRAMANEALKLVEDDSIAIFDASTSVLQLARALPQNIRLTAIVNALPIALELSRRSEVVLTFLGGTMRETSLSFTGPLSEVTLRKLYADTAFLSARGLSLNRGLTEANPYECSLKELMICNASRVIALADSSKLGRTALSSFASINEIDVLVTDDGADPEILAQLKNQDLDVRVAHVAH